MPIDFPYIHRELAKKGVTLSLLWTEYCAAADAAGKHPYMSTQFGDLCRKWAKISKATMRISRKPGETFEVDWARATVDIHDSVTGEITPAYLFVGALSCSSFVYAELCRDMKSENWLLCHVHAYEYFGGVTRLLVPDNLKAGVTKNTRYETSIPRTYQETADYYDTAIVPARPKAPMINRTQKDPSSLPPHGFLLLLGIGFSFPLRRHMMPSQKSWNFSMISPLKPRKDAAAVHMRRKNSNLCSRCLPHHMSRQHGTAQRSRTTRIKPLFRPI